MHATDPYIDAVQDGTLQLMACQYASPGVNSKTEPFQWYPKGHAFTPSDDPTMNLATAIRLLSWEIERQERKRTQPKAKNRCLFLEITTTPEILRKLNRAIFGLHPFIIDYFPYKCVERRHNPEAAETALLLEGWNRVGEIHVGDKIDIEGHHYLVTRADPPDEVQTTDRLSVALDD
jgi:hypothetical protein